MGPGGVYSGAGAAEPLGLFIQAAQGGNVAPLFHHTILYKRYEHGHGGGRCCSASEPTVEVVTEAERRLLYKRTWWKWGVTQPSS